MKLGKLLLVGATILVGFTASAQDDDKERECKRMRFLAGEALKVENYAEASMYYLKGEQICGGYDEGNWGRLIASLRYAVQGEQDAGKKMAYNDTLAQAWDRQEAAGFYKESDDLVRAAAELQGSNPDRTKADKLFQRGIKSQGAKTHESYVVYAYYNAVTMFSAMKAEEQPVMKERLINDYFDFSKLATEANMSVRTQESLTSYLNMIVKSCEDLTPQIPGFITGLPTEKEARVSGLSNMISLMEEKKCTESDEFLQLVNALIEADPTSIDAKIAKAKVLLAKKDYKGAIAVFKEIKEASSDEAQKNEMQYSIATCYSRMGSHKAAHGAAMSVNGEYRSKALKLAGQSVAALAMSCGDSTFERKCNYIYADRLMSQAGAGKKYSGNYPTSGDIFDAGSPSSVSLSCWGVSVNPNGE